VVFIATVIGGVIDEPFPINQVQFRSPDVIAVATQCGRRPNANALVDTDARDGSRSADVYPPIVSGLGVVIETPMENHPGIGGMGREDRINKLFAFVRSLLIETTTTNPAAASRPAVFTNDKNGPILQGPIVVSLFV
jgi:hypothetical protein